MPERVLAAQTPYNSASVCKFYGMCPGGPAVTVKARNATALVTYITSSSFGERAPIGRAGGCAAVLVSRAWLFDADERDDVRDDDGDVPPLGGGAWRPRRSRAGLGGHKAGPGVARALAAGRRRRGVHPVRRAPRGCNACAGRHWQALWQALAGTTRRRGASNLQPRVARPFLPGRTPG